MPFLYSRMAADVSLAINAKPETDPQVLAAFVSLPCRYISAPGGINVLAEPRHHPNGAHKA